MLTRAVGMYRKALGYFPKAYCFHCRLAVQLNALGKFDEAVQEFREAVRLDPDYINAWKQLAGVTDRPADIDRAELNLLRLDPRRKHDSADLSTVSDLKALGTLGRGGSGGKICPARTVRPVPAGGQPGGDGPATPAPRAGTGR